MNLDALAKAAGCHRRTLERWRAEGAPMPKRGEKLAAWVERLRAWDQARPRRAGRVFEQPGAAPAGAAAAAGEPTDWEQQSRKALALTRLHDLAVKRGQFLPRDRVVDEWARRAFAVSRRFLALPRQLAGAVTASPEVRAQIEAEGLRIVREALLDYVAHSELTPTPAPLQQLDNLEGGA